jgi:hypothetical protein
MSRVATEVLSGIATEVLVMLQLGCLLSCNSSDKIIKITCLELELKCSWSCNAYALFSTNIE